MCDKQTESHQTYKATAQGGANLYSPPESHMVYELKQKREYHIQQLVLIQAAIDALNRL